MKREQLLAPEQYNITQEFESYAADPQKVAIRWLNDKGDKREITYQELLKQANRLANALVKQGLQKGDKVLVMLPRIPEAYVTYIACLKAGLVVIPSSEMLRAKDLSYRINHGEAKAVIAYQACVPEFEKIEEPLPSLQYKFVVGEAQSSWLAIDTLLENESDYFETVPTHRDDMAFLSYTSGTTGNPKGVVHVHGWGYAHLQVAAKQWLDIKENDVVWATAGPGWAKWVWSPFLSVLGLGATAVVYHGPFDPVRYLSIMEEYQVNVLCCTPTEYRLMAKVDGLERYSLTHLRSAVSAGEPLNREVIDTFRRYFNVDVRDGYGQTENTLLVGTLKGMEIKPGSMGKPTPGNRVEIINEDGEPVGVGEVGDIAVHRDTPALFKEYYKDPERTKAAYRGEYYLTGDQARKDEDGYFWFEGRSDDIIISSGYTIGPFEVEDALVKHPAVRECAVVASPDEVRGHVVKAFVVLKNPEEAKDPTLVERLQEHVKSLTAPYKYPRKIEFVDSLPKTTSGKIRRVELRQREKERFAARS
ncbi:AMP-dependent synthetase and ligase [Caldalkalibacillus thermarum TA2.A1]|uniref:AMP-dependent synthetase and ligase n=1 Tax=Caldalkalibacillus thermarum (strain TA2.A1) TaxID=986075 RepID=F5L5I9_CALTT|nr:acyl--CoA ligase [Caldalkalibacillus thermarum]EGL83387.1 AMP-dependent synthetase and ligase [Caldalkalibacillus thermarum TA2.A1]QZT34540.1 acyl--CoA ligase [Caldalkalibacillus thermarum TA2.A1]